MAGTLAAVVILSPTANAEPNQVNGFLNDVRAMGFTVNKDTQWAVLAVGLSVCVDLFNGHSPLSEVNQASELFGVSQAKAAEFIELAVVDLCPRAAQGVAA